MKSINSILFLLFVIILISCGKKEVATSLNCEKLTSREEAEDLMRQENDVRFTDSTSIVENLIGEWGLIGVQPGWTGFEIGEECIKLIISADKIVLEDLSTGNDSESAWNLKTLRVNGYEGYIFETNEDTWNNRMGMQIFSENIMFGSGGVDDGDTYIYEKLE